MKHEVRLTIVKDKLIILSIVLCTIDIPNSEMKNAEDALYCEWKYCGLLEDWRF